MANQRYLHQRRLTVTTGMTQSMSYIIYIYILSRSCTEEVTGTFLSEFEYAQSLKPNLNSELLWLAASSLTVGQ